MTPLPTATPRPTATPFPTARAESTAADKDIYRRTPAVQEVILRQLAVKLCAAVSPRELFRIDQISFLPDLVDLEVTAEGAAACQLFDRATLERLFEPRGGAAG